MEPAADIDASDPVERARALSPLVRAAADEAERARRLPQRVAEALAKAGLYRIAEPRDDGAEHSPATQIRTIEAIARADGSAGWNLMIGIENFGLLAGAFARAGELFADPLAILCSSSAAVGRAEPVAGGYRVRGRWPFVSGCHNSRYFAGIAAVQREGGGPGEARYVLAACEDARILDTWHVGGLRGSGSHDVELDDVFVAEEDTVVYPPSPRRAPGRESPARRIPVGSRLAYNKVGVGLGIARAAIDHFVELATGKVPFMSSTTLRERAFAQRALGRAEARLRGARAAVLDVADELWARVSAGEGFPIERRAILQIACSDAAAGCAEAVDLLCEAAGTTANRLDSPLERYARDVRVVRTHTTVAPHHVEDAGRVLLGLEPRELMLKM